MTDVYFFKSPTCGPCKRFMPVVMSAVTDLDLPLIVTDVSKAPDFAKEHNVTAVPTLIVMTEGEEPQELYRLVGATTKAELVDLLRSFS